MANVDGQDGIRAARGRPERGSVSLAWLLCFLVVLAASSISTSLVSSASADEGEQNETAPPFLLTPELIKEGIASSTRGSELPETDPQAAHELSHGDLDRGEALRLLNAVFGSAIENPGGLLDEMPKAEFIGDHAAVMQAGEVAAAETEGPEVTGAKAREPVLIESSVPLKAEDAEGAEAPVDLSLERSEGELKPANPLVEAGIPTALEDGISLGTGQVELEFPEAQGERAPSTVEGSSAFYPNVEDDTDLLVSPVAGGVETMTQIRTPDAPHTQLVHLRLPEGAQVTATDGGGVEVKAGEKPLLNVAPPSAIDAAGTEVPVTTTVSGRNIEITVSPEEGTAYPILVDPVWTIESYDWTWGGSSFAGWSPVSYTPSYQALTYAYPSTNIPALNLTSGFPGGASPNTGAQWQFWVPRYASDMEKYGVPPQDFISGVFTEGMMLLLEGNSSAWPGLVAGIIDTESNQWVSNLTYTGDEGEISGWAGHANFWNYYEPPSHYAEDVNGKVFVYGLITIENEPQAKYRIAIAAHATTEVSDHNTPAITEASAPAGWWNTGEVPIEYAASDAGLGVDDLEIVPPGGILNGFGYGSSPEFPVGCTGVAASPCPRQVGSSTPGSPKLSVNVAAAPEGIDHYRLAAMDPLYSSGFSEGPVSHVAEGQLAVKVDHSPPELSLSGSVTEQGSLGIKRPHYTLKYKAVDGTQNPPTYTATGYEGTLNHPGDIVRNGEAFWIADKGNNRIVKLGLSGEVLGTYNSVGTSQLDAPSGIDSDASGNVWVADTGNDRLVEFRSDGEWLRKVGRAGSGDSEFSGPQGIAVAPDGDVWVADTGNDRIQEFNSSGGFLGSFGSEGAGPGQFDEPTALAVAPDGDVWVADTGNDRIEKLNGEGEYLASYGSPGSGNGQFDHPVGIQADRQGNVWVADQGNGRVEQFSELGEYLNQFGAKGTGAGQLSFVGASGITTSPGGALWIIDSGDSRLESWNAPEGTRSGVRSVVVKVDNEVVSRQEASCPQGGCRLGGEWELEAAEYEPGPHTIEVTATDGVGLSSTETVHVELEPDVTPPSIGLSGSMTEQGTLGTTLPQYRLKLTASDGKLPALEGSAEPTAGEVAAWPFDEGEGTVAHDATGHGHEGTIEGVGWTSGKFGEALRFTRGPSEECVKVPDPPELQLPHEFTFEAWVRPEGYETADPVIAKGLDPGGGDSYSFGIGFTQAGRVEGWAEGESIYSPETIEEDAWTHIAYSYDGQDMHIYVDGEQVSDKLVGPEELESSGPLWIGCSGPGEGEVFDGKIDEVRIYDRALDEGEVAEDEGTPIKTASPEAPVQSGIASVEVSVDGTNVDRDTSACTTEDCSVSSEWTLDASEYPGRHTVVVKATDGAGNTTIETLSLDMQPDETKPTLQLGGKLANAPEGWVQQEAYGFDAAAADPGGYGVTSLAFRIDGTTVASRAETCPAGACQLSISKDISMAAYSGGAHQAEVIATDGAGNSTTRKWTINVDPEGHVSTAEATATLEAVEGTSGSNLVGEAKEEGLEGTEAGLGLEATENGFSATGSQAPVSLGAEPGEPMIVEVPEARDLYSCPAGSPETAPEAGEVQDEPEASEEECIPLSEGSEAQLNPVEVTPVVVGGGAGAVHLVEENAAVSANTGNSVDTVTRPLNDGGMIFEAIRDDTAPETYSYEVALGEDQELRQIDETDVQVYYSFGFPAFLISAVPAHDAIGTEVPTTIHITRENVVTLTVHYKAGTEEQPFVFPIVGGTGWEGGFISEEADFGLANEEGGTEEGSISEHGGSISLVSYGPPETVPHSSNAWDFEPLSLSPHERRFKFTYCWPKSIPGDPAPPESFEGFSETITPSSPMWRNITPEASECHREDFHGIRWATSVHGHFEYKTHHWVRVDQESINCGGWGEEYPTKMHCKIAGTGVVPGPADVFAEYRFAPGRGAWEWLDKPTCFIFGGAIYPRKAPTTGPVPYERPLIWFREPLTYAPLSCEWDRYEETALNP